MERSGGAAVSEVLISQGASLANTSQKKKKETLMILKIERSSEKKRCVTCAVSAANNLVIA